MKLTIKEMQTAVNYGICKCRRLFESVGKPIALDFDGPNQVGSFTQEWMHQELVSQMQQYWHRQVQRSGI